MNHASKHAQALTLSAVMWCLIALIVISSKVSSQQTMLIEQTACHEIQISFLWPTLPLEQNKQTWIKPWFTHVLIDIVERWFCCKKLRYSSSKQILQQLSLHVDSILVPFNLKKHGQKVLPCSGKNAAALMHVACCIYKFHPCFVRYAVLNFHNSRRPMLHIAWIEELALWRWLLPTFLEAYCATLHQMSSPFVILPWTYCLADDNSSTTVMIQADTDKLFAMRLLHQNVHDAEAHNEHANA